MNPTRLTPQPKRMATKERKERKDRKAPLSFRRRSLDTFFPPLRGPLLEPKEEREWLRLRRARSIRGFD
jgi:hypothetical protein